MFPKHGSRIDTKWTALFLVFTGSKMNGQWFWTCNCQLAGFAGGIGMLMGVHQLKLIGGPVKNWGLPGQTNQRLASSFGTIFDTETSIFDCKTPDVWSFLHVNHQLFGSRTPPISWSPTTSPNSLTPLSPRASRASPWGYQRLPPHPTAPDVAWEGERGLLENIGKSSTIASANL